MKIRKTFNFSEEDHKAISYYYGDKELATYETIDTWIDTCIGGSMEDFHFDLCRKNKNKNIDES